LEPIAKAGLRKRHVVGWRQVARRISENRSRQRTPPAPVVKQDNKSVDG
jgi:hypothetical protein